MKQFSVIAALLIAQCVGFSLQSTRPSGVRTQFKPLPNAELPFSKGEFLKYDIQYGFVKAGEAELQVKTITSRQNRPVYHVIGTGKTTGMTDWFFHTEDKYESFIDTARLVPLEFIRDVDEGGYEINRHITFNQNEHTAIDRYKRDTIFELKKEMQDIFSAFYYARSMDVEGILLGDEIHIPVFLDHNEFPFILKYGGIEMISLDNLTIECMKFTPVVQEGRVFKEKETMTLWVSNDQNRIPVLLKSELTVGSIQVKLNGFKNISHPLKVIK